MGFDKTEVASLLSKCGRRCCICGELHRVQVHHIVPGDDNIENGIPLCPNCHDQVHTEYSEGRTTRPYSPEELIGHRSRTIDQVARGEKWQPGSTDWANDKSLIIFFAQCLDRPAFRTYFHQELSFVDFDQAMEDTIIALNTGYWRMRNGTLINRFKGKTAVVKPEWRENLEKITQIIEEIRRQFQNSLGLNQMLCHLRRPNGLHRRDMEDVIDRLEHDRELGAWMDGKRQDAINIMNSMLDEVGLQPLPGLRQQ